MKRFLLLNAVGLAPLFCAFGLNYFTPGTSWISDANPHDPDNCYFQRATLAEYHGLGNDNGIALNVIRRRYNVKPTENVFLDMSEKYYSRTWCYLRTDGDKVYFYFKNDPEKEFLMYDFGLEVGEGTYVYRIFEENAITNLEPVRSYVRRIERPDNFKEINEDFIFLQEFADENCDNPYEAPIGWWIPGVGGAGDITRNAGFGIEGNLSILREVSNQKEVYYSDWQKEEIADTQLFVPGTEWIVESYPCCPEPDKNYIGADKLGEETFIDGVKAMPLYFGSIENPDKLGGYIRVEGRKVYARSPKPENQGWYLLYNFGLQPGEGDWVYVLNFPFEPVTQSYMKCLGRRPCAVNPELQVMYLEEYLRNFGASETDENPDIHYCGQGRWISGIGSMDGVISNAYFEADGGGSKLLEVRRNGESVFSDRGNEDVSVRQVISGGEMPEIRINGLDIEVVSGLQSGGIEIYSIEGAHIGSIGSSRIFRLPSEGIYILRSGNESSKIFVR